jgi:hypothetical protein
MISLVYRMINSNREIRVNQKDYIQIQVEIFLGHRSQTLVDFRLFMLYIYICSDNFS